MNGHLFVAGSTMLCPPYFFKRLPPTKDIVAFLYKLFRIPIELIITTSLVVSSDEKIEETYISVNQDSRDCNFSNKWLKK